MNLFNKYNLLFSPEQSLKEALGSPEENHETWMLRTNSLEPHFHNL